MAGQGSPGANWYPDPAGRHQYRYWDGSAWTDDVATGSTSGKDSLGGETYAAPKPLPPRIPEPAPKAVAAADGAATGVVAVAAASWRRFRAWPVAGQIIAAFAVIILLAGVAGAIGGGSNDSKATSSTSEPVRAAAPRTTTSSSTTTTTPVDDKGEIDPTASTMPAPVAAVPETEPTQTACRADPLANVYHPYRLRVVDACATVTGTVASVRTEDDGDVHFDLALDPQFANLLTPVNVSGQHGWLVVEIVPADRPGCTVGQPPQPVSGTYDYGICTGANVATPAMGAHVAVTGPYVIDLHHGWAEIHPAWWIGAPYVAPPPTAPPPTTRPYVAPTSPPATQPPPTTSGVQVVHPGAFCSPQGATGVTSAGTPMVCTTTPTDPRARWRSA